MFKAEEYCIYIKIQNNVTYEHYFDNMCSIEFEVSNFTGKDTHVHPAKLEVPMVYS